MLAILSVLIVNYHTEFFAYLQLYKPLKWRKKDLQHTWQEICTQYGHKLKGETQTINDSFILHQAWSLIHYAIFNGEIQC